MEKRYQVFVSSTYDDLQTERQEVMQALLELDCIPSGMELFPAANESQWNFLKKVICDCDCYIVIVAGRYGSRSPSGVGYTEMEYRYAEEIGRPTIAFLHRDPEQLPAKKTERDSRGQEQLRIFRAYVERKLCKHWSSPAELGSIVSRGLVQLIKSNPAIGWVRGSDAGDPAENARLRARIEKLETELATFASSGPKGSENLAQGSDSYTLEFSVKIRDSFKSWDGKELAEIRQYALTLTWDEICAVALPPLQLEGTEHDVGLSLASLCQRKSRNELLAASNEAAKEIFPDLSKASRDSVIIQLRALGLLTEGVRKRSPSHKSSYWKLTPYGDSVMTRLCAVPRKAR